MHPVRLAVLLHRQAEHARDQPPGPATAAAGHPGHEMGAAAEGGGAGLHAGPGADHVRGRGVKFCAEHWADLKAKVDAAGLSSFISNGGEEAAKRMVENGFDPLMGAHNALVSNAMSTAGLAIMMPNDDGTDRCPLCFLINGCPCAEGEACSYRTWMDRAVAEQADEARRRGLIASA